MNTALKTAPKNGQEQKDAAAKVVQMPDVKLNPTENKIQRIIAIGQKIKRRSEVSQAKANLEAFILTAEHDGAEIEFEDANRKRYASKDVYLMQKIQKCILACCDEEIAELNAHIDAFTI